MNSLSECKVPGQMGFLQSPIKKSPFGTFGSNFIVELKVIFDFRLKEKTKVKAKGSKWEGIFNGISCARNLSTDLTV